MAQTKNPGKSWNNVTIISILHLHTHITDTYHCYYGLYSQGVKPGPVEKMTVMSAKPKQRTMAKGVR